jgi:hypothetical protein
LGIHRMGTLWRWTMTPPQHVSGHQIRGGMVVVTGTGQGARTPRARTHPPQRHTARHAPRLDKAWQSTGPKAMPRPLRGHVPCKQVDRERGHYQRQVACRLGRNDHPHRPHARCSREAISFNGNTLRKRPWRKPDAGVAMLLDTFRGIALCPHVQMRDSASRIASTHAVLLLLSAHTSLKSWLSIHQSHSSLGCTTWATILKTTRGRSSTTTRWRRGRPQPFSPPLFHVSMDALHLLSAATHPLRPCPRWHHPRMPQHCSIATKICRTDHQSFPRVGVPSPSHATSALCSWHDAAPPITARPVAERPPRNGMSIQNGATHWTE